MLAIAKNEVGKSATQGIEMAREGVLKPRASILAISFDCAFEVGDDQTYAAAGLQHAHAFPQQEVQFIEIEMLEHVRRVNRVGGIGRKWQPVSDIEPEVELVEKIAVDIQKTRQIFRTTAQMQVGRAVRQPSMEYITMQQVVGKGSFGDAPKGDVFVALVKQPTPPKAVARL